MQTNTLFGLYVCVKVNQIQIRHTMHKYSALLCVPNVSNSIQLLCVNVFISHLRIDDGVTVPDIFSFELQIDYLLVVL